MIKKLLIGISIVMIALSLPVGAALAATDNGMGMESTTAATPADRDSFNALWKKTLDTGSFTGEQQKRLATELEAASQKLSENFMGLDDLLKQQKAGKKTATLQKRLDLKEAERDLIVSQTKLKLGEFLTKEQVNLLLMAAFHGISMSLASEEHLNSIHNDMNQSMDPVEQLAMDLGKLAGKLNQNCQAVTLEIIRESLGTKTNMDTDD